MGFNSIDSTGRYCAWGVPNGVFFLLVFGREEEMGVGGDGIIPFGLGGKPLLRCSSFFSPKT